MKIIIIEPDSNRQRSLRTILSSLGYRSADMEIYPDAKIGESNLKKKKFDLAFVQMFLEPGAGGVDFIKAIRETRLKNLAIILFCSEVTQENIVAAVNAGADAVLSFPFSVTDTETAITTAIKKSARRESQS